MKKILSLGLTVAALVAMSNVTTAQVSTKIEIKVESFLSIEPGDGTVTGTAGPATAPVLFEYGAPAALGLDILGFGSKSETKNDHLKVQSSASYDLLFRAGGDNFAGPSSNTIPLDVVNVSLAGTGIVSSGTLNILTGLLEGVGSIVSQILDQTGLETLLPGSFTGKPLTNANQTFGNGTLGTQKFAAGARSFDVKYSIPAAKAQQHILGKPSGSYIQTVIYSVSN